MVHYKNKFAIAMFLTIKAFLKDLAIVYCKHTLAVSLLAKLKLYCIDTVGHQGAVKNGQSRENDNIGYTRYRMKTIKTQNKTQRTKQMSNIDPHQQPGVNPGVHEGQAAPASY
jgi:hypothetical protein